MITVYSNRELEKKEKGTGKVGEKRRRFYLKGRDFNARTGEKGEIYEGGKAKERKSKDKQINREEEVLLDRG